MPRFEIYRTDSFLKDVKEHRKNHELLKQLDKRIKKLEENADIIGKELSGRLAGLKSIRVMKNFRLIFKVKLQDRKVDLMAIDHRGQIY